MLSEKNKIRAKEGASLIVDETWLKAFPEDADLMGQPVPVQNITITKNNLPPKITLGETVEA